MSSFEGAPREVTGSFSVPSVLRPDGYTTSWSAGVKDLTGSPDTVGRKAYFSGCVSLESAKGAPRRIGWSLNLKKTQVTP